MPKVRKFEDYLSFFPDNDDGVPPFCRLKHCPFNHESFVNTNPVTTFIGSAGFQHFDTNRKFYFAWCTIFTIISIALACYSAAAYGMDLASLQNANLGYGTVNDIDTRTKYTFWIGIRSIGYKKCVTIPNPYQVKCDTDTIEFYANGPYLGNDPVIKRVSDMCYQPMVDFFLPTLGVIVVTYLSFLQVQTRMRTIGDCPIQKILGFAEIFGIFYMIAFFKYFTRDCIDPLPTLLKEESIADESSFIYGPVITTLSLCIVIGSLRSILHMVTPTPTPEQQEFDMKAVSARNLTTSDGISVRDEFA